MSWWSNDPVVEDEPKAEQGDWWKNDPVVDDSGQSAAFQEWKNRLAPNDSGEDYDFRSAFKAGVQPDASGHWPDTFKRSNHPTFSNESIYATGPDAIKAGHWDGDQFIPAPAEIQQADEQQAMEYGMLKPEIPANPMPFLEKPLVEFGHLPVTRDQALPARFGSAVLNKVGDFVSGLTSFQGLIGLVPPIGIAQITAQAPDLIDKVKEAEKTPPGSPERINAGLDVVATIGSLGAMGAGMKATLGRGFREGPKVAPDAAKSEIQSGPDIPVRSEGEVQSLQENPKLPNLGIKGLENETLIAQPEKTAEGKVEKPPTTTGVANRVLEEEAKAGRIDPIESGEGKSWREMVDLGREKLNAGADPQMIARRFQRNGRISAEDFSVVRAERERLAGETMAAENAVRQNPNDPNARKIYNATRQTETEWVRNVVQPAKTATSDIFRGMQGEAPIDATTFAGLRKAVVDIHGRDVAPNEVRVLNETANRTKRAIDESSESLQRASVAIENTLGRKAKPRSLEELRDHFAQKNRELTPC